jgi:hypothetical protein
MDVFAVNMMDFSHHGDGVHTITLKAIYGALVRPLKFHQITEFPFPSLSFLVFKIAADKQEYQNGILVTYMVIYHQLSVRTCLRAACNHDWIAVTSMFS